jgi:hypothetical protein
LTFSLRIFSTKSYDSDIRLCQEKHKMVSPICNKDLESCIAEKTFLYLAAPNKLMK